MPRLKRSDQRYAAGVAAGLAAAPRDASAAQAGLPADAAASLEFLDEMQQRVDRRRHTALLQLERVLAALRSRLTPDQWSSVQERLFRDEEQRRNILAREYGINDLPRISILLRSVVQQQADHSVSEAAAQHNSWRINVSPDPMQDITLPARTQSHDLLGGSDVLAPQPHHLVSGFPITHLARAVAQNRGVVPVREIERHQLQAQQRQVAALADYAQRRRVQQQLYLIRQTSRQAADLAQEQMLQKIRQRVHTRTLPTIPGLDRDRFLQAHHVLSQLVVSSKFRQPVQVTASSRVPPPPPPPLDCDADRGSGADADAAEGNTSEAEQQQEDPALVEARVVAAAAARLHQDEEVRACVTHALRAWHEYVAGRNEAIRVLWWPFHVWSRDVKARRRQRIKAMWLSDVFNTLIQLRALRAWSRHTRYLVSVRTQITRKWRAEQEACLRQATLHWHAWARTQVVMHHSARLRRQAKRQRLFPAFAALFYYARYRKTVRERMWRYYRSPIRAVPEFEPLPHPTFLESLFVHFLEKDRRCRALHRINFRLQGRRMLHRWIQYTQMQQYHRYCTALGNVKILASAFHAWRDRSSTIIQRRRRRQAASKLEVRRRVSKRRAALMAEERRQNQFRRLQWCNTQISALSDRLRAMNYELDQERELEPVRQRMQRKKDDEITSYMMAREEQLAAQRESEVELINSQLEAVLGEAAGVFVARLTVVLEHTQAQRRLNYRAAAFEALAVSVRTRRRSRVFVKTILTNMLRRLFRLRHWVHRVIWYTRLIYMWRTFRAWQVAIAKRKQYLPADEWSQMHRRKYLLRQFGESIERGASATSLRGTFLRWLEATQQSRAEAVVISSLRQRTALLLMRRTWSRLRSYRRSNVADDEPVAEDAAEGVDAGAAVDALKTAAPAQHAAGPRFKFREAQLAFRAEAYATHVLRLSTYSTRMRHASQDLVRRTVLAVRRRLDLPSQLQAWQHSITQRIEAEQHLLQGYYATQGVMKPKAIASMLRLRRRDITEALAGSTAMARRLFRSGLVYGITNHADRCIALVAWVFHARVPGLVCLDDRTLPWRNVRWSLAVRKLEIFVSTSVR